MFHRHRQNPALLMRIGLVCFVLAAGVRFLLPSGPLSPDLRDGAQGLLLGLSIGMMFVSLWKGRRHGPNGGGTSD